MRLTLPSRSTLLHTLETLLLGIGGGLLFAWLQLPGGLISGAMITVAIAAFAGRPLGMPPLLTQTILVLLGISLGSLVSRQMLHDMSAYPLTITL
ncbi:MAG: AbrB family transcriptional regulator, partial [Rhizobiales bacterium]|nr:AbrB family transcriptional regulator [Hyphomicrobiales bacterium]